MLKPTLTPADYRRAAAILNCEVAVINAVSQKESGGGGFLKGRILTVRFEGHIFREKTTGTFDKAYPSLSHRYQRNNPHNKGTVGDWRRLEAARKLAGDVAFTCASYGMFQIMGFHFRLLGYANPYAMVQAFNESEGRQLDGFVQFIRQNGMAPLLRDHRFAEFANRYNGTDSDANDYGPDIQRLYEYYRTQD